jgi:hypothetical protein
MTAPDIRAAERDLGFAPRSFAEGLQETFGQSGRARLSGAADLVCSAKIRAEP